MTTRSVLALDLASQFGFCEGEPGGEPRFGSARFAPAGASQEEIFSGAIRWTAERLSGFLPRVIVFEAPELFRLQRGQSTKAAIEVLFGLPAVIQGVAYRYGVPVIRKAEPGDVRQFFIGKRNLKRALAKPAVIREAKARGWDVKNDDEADACAIWAFTCAAFDPSLRTQSPQTPLFKELR